jgi:hypothetical protein
MLTAVALVGVAPASSAAESTADEQARVSEIIVRYQAQAPVITKKGRPWGAQCVPRVYRSSLQFGREIGAGMRVVGVQPPVSVAVARVIARHVEDCPFVAWAEADAVLFTIE